jgi:peptidoglycan/LPS O-acetylase OafA/YrhL
VAGWERKRWRVAPRGGIVVTVFAILILLVVAASVITTTDPVTAIVSVVVAFGFLIWVARSGGGVGGWSNSRRMGS